MIEQTLGLPIDIHGGGNDLIFPHHENEMAQGVCADHAGRLRQLLAAQRLPEHGRGEDVQEPGQRGAGPRPGDPLAAARRCAGRCWPSHYRQPLAWTDERGRQAPERAGHALRRPASAPRDVRGRLRDEPVARPSWRRWRTTSTRPGPTPSCSPWRGALETGDRRRARPRPRASCWPAARLIGFLQADPEAWFQGGADPALKARIEALIAERVDGARRQGLGRRRRHPRRTHRARRRGDGQRRRARPGRLKETRLMRGAVKIEHRIGVAGAGRGDLGGDLGHRRLGGWNPLYPKAGGRVAHRRDADLSGAARPDAARPSSPVVVDWVPNEQIIWRLSLLGGLVRILRYIEIETLADDRLHLLQRRDVRGSARARRRPTHARGRSRPASPPWARR